MATWDNSTLPRTRKEAKALGIPRYFLDKPCPHGHNDARYTANGKCVVCMLKDIRNYHSRHKEKENARCRQWAKDNPERNSENSKRWWNSQHQERRHELSKASYQRHRDEKIKYSAEWQKRNPELLLTYRRNTRHRKKAGGGTVTHEQWTEILERFNNQCPGCGSTTEPLTMDHIVPVSNGGSHSASNVQPLCRPCNTRKGTKTIRYEPWGEHEDLR